MKRINKYLIFLNKTNGQTRTKKSTVSNILKRMEYFLFPLLDFSKLIRYKFDNLILFHTNTKVVCMYISVIL